MSVSERQIHRKVITAIRELFRRDRSLLENDLNERTITHKLGVYVQGQFRGWNVDCEYNRNHDDAKRLDLNARPTRTNDTQGQTVFPDIIVHRRRSDANLLVIELKKSTNRERSDYDVRKLRAFKAQLGYRYAVFVKLQTGMRPRRRAYGLQWI